MMNISEISQFDDLITEFLRQIKQGQNPVFPDAFSFIDERIAQIDRMLSAQLNEIIHHQEFQELEAGWRGIHYLVMHAQTNALLKIFIFQAAKRELFKDFETTLESEHSKVFAKIRSGAASGVEPAPFGVLIGDYEFGDYWDTVLLEHIAQAAAECHCPFIAAASPELFLQESFKDFYKIENLAEVFEGNVSRKWRSIRESVDSCYVGLCLPRICLRPSYNERTSSIKTFVFSEDNTDDENYLWGNAAYAFGTRLTEAFNRHHWCANICGAEGGRVKGLATVEVKTGDDNRRRKSSVEIFVSEEVNRQLDKLGFISLVNSPDENSPTFFPPPRVPKRNAMIWKTPVGTVSFINRCRIFLVPPDSRTISGRFCRRKEMFPLPANNYGFY